MTKKIERENGMDGRHSHGRGVGQGRQLSNQGMKEKQRPSKIVDRGLNKGPSSNGNTMNDQYLITIGRATRPNSNESV